MSVAQHTGIGCAAGKVFVHKVVDHKITKLFTDVKDEMSKAVLYCRHARIIKTVEITTPSFFFTSSAAGIVPCFHRDPNHFITLLIKHESCNRAVDTAAHCYQNFTFCAHNCVSINSSRKCTKSCPLGVISPRYFWTLPEFFLN